MLLCVIVVLVMVLFTILVVMCVFFFFFKQKTAYEMRISDWSSDVCSSDLGGGKQEEGGEPAPKAAALSQPQPPERKRHRHAQPDQRARQQGQLRQIGRASCRERVCQYV